MQPPKHPRLVRWTHWLNAVFFGLMVWSGLRIYWANPVYIPFSDRFYALLGLQYGLAHGMAVHFLVGWLFALNGAVYAAYTLFSGEWRHLAPERRSWRDALLVTLHDLRLRAELPPQGRYNAAQRVAYTAVALIGAGLVATGLAMYKPVQLSWLSRALGGYQAARLEHFWLMIALLLFLVVHVAQVARAGWENLRAMIAGLPDRSERRPPAPPEDPAAERRLTRRAFLTGGAAAALGGAAFGWILTRPEIDGLAGPLRGALEGNGRLWRALSRPSCRAPERAAAVAGKEPRLNGDLGLENAIDLARWRLRVVDAGGRERRLTLRDVRALPRATMTTELRCIEGWSDENTFVGARFSDLARKLGLANARYAGLETPGRRYYVSLDIATMLHPQTLLVYEMNGAPLTADHGAPLRLFTPLKYGIKSLKRIGLIRLSDQRPPDYWEERGYDWYAGL